MAKAARLLLGALLLSPFANSEPKRTTTCVAHNVPFDVMHYDKQTGKSTVVEQEDWHVTCTVTQGKKVVWTGELPLAHPTQFQDAMDAIRRWMKEAGRDAKASMPQPQGQLPDAGRGPAGDAPPPQLAAQPPGPS